MLLTLSTTPTFAEFPSIVETDPVMASRRWVPYPVTTTASRIAAACVSVMFAVTVPPGVIVTSCNCGLYPMRVARRRWIPAGIPLKRKLPSMWVSMRCGDPAMATSTLGRACCVVASTTLPVTAPVESCAPSCATHTKLLKSTGTT